MWSQKVSAFIPQTAANLQTADLSFPITVSAAPKTRD